MRLDPDYVTADQYALGTGESAIVSERETPTDFTFTADEDQSVLQHVELRVTNSGTASATEDVTLTLARSFGGADTPVAEETKTGVTVAAGDVETPKFLAGDAGLRSGTYHVTATTSGTTLTVEQVDVYTRDTQLAWELQSGGRARLIDHNKQTRMAVSPLTSGVRFPEGIVGQDGTRVASFAGAGLTVDDSGDTPTLQSEMASTAETVTVSGDGTPTVSVPHSLGSTPTAANVTPASADAMGDFYRSGLTDTAIELTYGTAPPSGTDNLAYDVLVASGGYV